MDDLATITRNYWIAVQRIQRMDVPALDKVMVLADVQAAYRRERAALARENQQLSMVGRMLGRIPKPS